MTLKHIIISATIVAAGLFSLNAGLKGEPKDGLDKRKFTVSIVELKPNAPAKKGVADEFEFKNGKGVFSQFLYDNYGFKWVKYDLKKDSTFTDEEQNEVHIYEAEASATDENDQTMVMTCTVEDY